MHFDGDVPLSARGGNGAAVAARGAAGRSDGRAIERLFTLAHDLLGVLDYEGRLIEINPAWTRALGWKDDELRGKPVIELLHPEDAVAVASEKAVADAGGETISYPARFRRRDGSYAWLECSSVYVPSERRIYTVARDISELRRAEADRSEAQRLVEAQARALLELSTPVVPITDRVLAMPLVGVLDTRRAQQVLDTLLHEVSRTGALVAILDVTGVKVVDTQTADAVLRAARAVRLLGAEVVLTGIQPEMARVIAGMEEGLRGCVIRGTFESGIEYALKASRR